MHWGDVKRTNVMLEDGPCCDSNRALVAKIKSTTALPSCLNSCTAV